jgi:cytochrome c553
MWALLASAPLLASNAFAGDYHKNATLLCSQCHVMHFSQQHGYNPNGTGFFVPPQGATAHHFLLRDEVNNLCLACHDSNGIAPDVLGATNLGNGPTDVRLAGYLNRVGLPGADGFEATGHTLDSTETAPGSNPAWSEPAGLNCTNCHHQHGSASGVTNGNAYRNLRTRGYGNYSSSGSPLGYISYATDTNDLTKDVFERQTAEYDEADMDWNEPTTTKSAVALFCAGCHSNFHGAIGGPEIGGVAVGSGFDEFIRHPAAEVNIGAVGGGHSSLSQYNLHTNKVKVMSSAGVWSPAGSDVTPTCITCHKSHGNGNAFGLIYRQGTGTLTENGDSAGNQLEDLCGQCHVQANYFFQNP